MYCPRCKSKLKKILVKVEDADSKAISYQCPECGYAEFDKKSAEKVIKEIKLKESPLQIKQRIIKLSHDRLGIYFNKNIIRSLNLKPGENIYLSVPDKKHIVLQVGE